MVNQLIGFGVFAPAPLVTTLISGATGTLIGNMTTSGGLAAAFDGNYSQSNATAATGGTTTDYVGKQWSSAKTITACKAYAPNNRNFVGGTGSDGVTLSLRGSNDGSSWTQLATSGAITTAVADVYTFTGINVAAAYTYHSLLIASAFTGQCAELEFYEDI